MFKPTPCLQRNIRRLRLNTKQASKDYYKGNRVGAMGQHTKWGGYTIDWARVRTYVVPDLTDFPLKPFVSNEVEYPRVTSSNSIIQEAANQLDRWKKDAPEQPMLETQTPKTVKQGNTDNVKSQKSKAEQGGKGKRSEQKPSRKDSSSQTSSRQKR